MSNKAKQSNAWWIATLFLALISFVCGVTATKYNAFPYNILKHVKNYVAGSDNYHYYSSSYWHKKSFFEIHGTNADIVMIGNSITDGAEWKELFPDLSIVNRGIGGDTTEGVLNRMESIYSTKAKKAFILIGINDFAQNKSVDEVFSNYQRILEQLQIHEITPYIQSTILAGERRVHLNNDIVKLNYRLKKLAEEKNITFIDLNNTLGENGKLKQSYSRDDIHLNGEGYSAWKEMIEKYMVMDH